MGPHIFWESKVIAVSFGGLNWWSELVWCSFGSDLVLFSSCVHLSTTNVEHLGSITSLEVIKAQSVRNQFTCCCSFLAWRPVSGLWFVSLMLDGEFLTFEVSCTVGISSSWWQPCPSGVIVVLCLAYSLMFGFGVRVYERGNRTGCTSVRDLLSAIPFSWHL